MRRGSSPSRPPPRGEGGGRLTKLFLPPQTPHRFQPIPHGLPCSLNPLPRELPRCAVVGAWFQPFFTYTNTYSGFPAAGCSGLGQQVPRAPQSLRVWVWGVAVPKTKVDRPLHLARKRPILVGVWVETETSRHGVDPLPLPKKGGRGAKGGSPLVAATLWWEGRGPGDWETAHVCSRLHWRPADPPLVCKKIFWVVARDSPDGKCPENSPLHMVKPPAAALRPQKEGDGFHGGGVVTWQRMVASHTNLCTHTGRGRGGGCGSISRVSRGSIIV